MKEYRDCTVYVTPCKDGTIDVSWKRNYPIPDEESEDALDGAYEDMVSIRKDGFGILCICAERYALGRRTYIPGYVCSIIKNHIIELSDNDIYVLIDDIEHPYGGYGDACDEMEWLILLKKLKEERSRRT